MASWAEFEAEAPELAALARGFFDAHAHKILATLRADGSPRVSGVETKFAEGELWFGSMPRGRKALDLRRDPRFALHSGSPDPPAWRGDAKVTGRAEEITDPERYTAVVGSPGDSHLFRADLTEVSAVRLGEPADHLVIEVWRPGAGVKAMRR